MYVITYKSSPATQQELAKIMGVPPYRFVNAYIAGPTKEWVISTFGITFGVNWRDRNSGIECQKAEVVK